MKTQVWNKSNFIRFNAVILIFVFTIISRISFGQEIAGNIGTVTVFIGYTGKNQTNDTHDSTSKFVKIHSVKDYERIFGKSSNKDYILYPSIRMFYENGGREAYVVSVGNINNNKPIFKKSDFINGISRLSGFGKSVLIVVPESVRLNPSEAGSVHSAMMKKAAELGNSFAILDIVDADQSIGSQFKPISNFKKYSGNLDLSYAAAYYPWVIPTNTREVVLKRNYFAIPYAIPPGAAIAGVMVRSDLRNGIWKAPANIALNGVADLSVQLTQSEMAELQIDAGTGKSINPIVDFQDKGILIWGARTLSGNDNFWRFIPVRRLVSQIEFDLKREISQSKNSPNNEETRKEVVRITENYLNQLWKLNAMAGSTPREAYFVKCGLGSTMTAQDIENGKLIVNLGVAVMKPAEFLTLSIVQQMSE